MLLKITLPLTGVLTGDRYTTSSKHFPTSLPVFSLRLMVNRRLLFVYGSQAATAIRADSVLNAMIALDW